MNIGLTKYLLLLLILPWVIAPFIYQNLNNPSNFIILVGFLYMPLPAIITILYLKKRKSILAVFYSGRINHKYTLYAILYVFLFNIINALIIYIFGNVLEISSFGFLNFEIETLQNNINKIVFLKNENITIKYFNSLNLIILAVTLPLIGILNLPFAIGEELAWRGYLFNKIKKTNKIAHNLIVGLIWGVWHAPIILMGYNFPSHPILGLFIFIIFTCAISFLFFYLREKSNSVLAPSIFHGSFNSSVIFITLFIKDGNNLFSNPVGISGILSMGIIYFFFLKSFYKKNVYN